MTTSPVPTAVPEPDTASRAQFEAIPGYLDGAEAAGLEHFELETRLRGDGQDRLRTLMQEHFGLRALREVGLQGIVDTQGVPHVRVEPDHARNLTTTFGDAAVRRLAYPHRGQSNLHPADAALNLPREQYSHCLRQLAAIEAILNLRALRANGDFAAYWDYHRAQERHRRHKVR